MRVRLTKTSIFSSKKDARRETPTKNKKAKTGQSRLFLGFTKKSSTLSCVVWAEESKNGFGFEIGPSYDDVPMTSPYVVQLIN